MDKFVDESGMVESLQHLCQGGRVVKVEVRLQGAPKMLQTSRVTRVANPYGGRVTRTSHLVGVLGAEYQEYVRAKLREAGQPADFVAQSRPWGTAMEPPIISHKGQLYMQVIVEDKKEPQYYVDGDLVSHSLIAMYLPKEETKSRGPGGVEVRTPKLRDVARVAVIDGKGGELLAFARKIS